MTKEDFKDFRPSEDLRVEMSAWAFQLSDNAQAEWVSTRGNLVRISLHTSSFSSDQDRIAVTMSGGEPHNFIGEDMLERAWCIAEVFREQENQA